MQSSGDKAEKGPLSPDRNPSIEAPLCGEGPNKIILAVLDDLFFGVKISESAKRAGLAVEFLKSEAEVLLRAKAQPALIVIDLNFKGLDTLKLVADLKACEDTKGIRVLGYLPHVQAELKRKAQEVGCDVVLPRSAFSQGLTQILTSE